MVPIGAASSLARAAVSRDSSSGEAPCRAFSSSERRRSFISPAARSVKVTARMRSSAVAPLRTSATMRATSSVVLPVPAAASTIKVARRSPRMRSRA